MNKNDIIGIYKFKPITNSNMATLKWKYNVAATDQVGDDPMDFDTTAEEVEKVGKNSLHVDVSFGSYQVSTKMFVCNIQNQYITSLTDKYPIYYMTYLFDRKFVSGKIVNFCLYFNLDDESKETMKDLKTCVGKTLSGYITLEFTDDDGLIQKYLKFIKTKKEEEMMKEMMVAKLETRDTLGETEMINIIEEMQHKLFDYLRPYDDFFKPIKFDQFVTRSNIVEKYCKVQVNDDIMKDFIKYVLEIRERERAKQYNFKYNLPKRVFDLAKIKENPDMVDEMLNNRDLDRSSDSESDD
jgi:hypothetical protein